MPMRKHSTIYLLLTLIFNSKLIELIIRSDIPLAPRNKVRLVSTFMPTFISKHLYKGGALTEELEFPLEK